MTTYAVGQRVTAAMLQELSDQGGTIIARGARSSGSGTTSGATELGVMRLDNLNLKAGFAYEVRTGNIRMDLSVTTDRAKVTLRHSSAGSATIASDEIGRAEIATNPGDVNSYPPVVGWIYPTVDQPTASVIMTLSRPTGTGVCSLLADTGHGIQLFVISHGTDPTDTGVDL